MNSLPWRLRLGAIVVTLVLAASACGGDSADGRGVETAEDEAAVVQDGDSPEPETAPGADAGGEGADPDSGESGAAPGPAEVGDPAANAQNMVRALFNIDPTPDAIDCLVAEQENLPGLESAVTSQTALFTDFDDDQIRDVSYGIARCVDPVALGDWATQGIGPQGEVRETAPACLTERFIGPQGEAIFHTLVALSFQFRYDPENVDSMIDTFVSCTPVSSLHGFFADRREATESDVIVDRDCLLERLGDPQVSAEFWSMLIEGSAPPSTAVDPYLDDCSAKANSDLAAEVPADFQAWASAGSLAEVAPDARNGIYQAEPPQVIDPTGEYQAVFHTGGGEIRIELFADTAPITVNNFVSLARDGFYDRTVFHRVLDGFMAQGGDPSGTGTGGPGYSFVDEFVDVADGGHAFDRPYLLAMANSGPNTNGSQFFITFAPTPHLDGLHTIFGEVVEGHEIVDAIERRDPNTPAGRGQILDSVEIVELSGG